MPSIAEIQPAANMAASNMKRKRDNTSNPGREFDDEVLMKINSHQQTQDHTLSQRIFKPLPQSRHHTKRQRIFTPSTSFPALNILTTGNTPNHPLSAPTSPHHEPAFTRPGITRATTTADLNLRPCHICHRQPRKIKELENFINCEGCGERTCFICIRKCYGVDLESPIADEEWMGDFDEAKYPENPTFGSRFDAETDPMAMSFGSLGGMEMEEDPPTPEGEVDLWDHARSMSDKANGHFSGAKEDPGWKVDGPRHRDIICSKCCVERGADGEIECLGCADKGEKHFST